MRKHWAEDTSNLISIYSNYLKLTYQIISIALQHLHLLFHYFLFY